MEKTYIPITEIENIDKIQQQHVQGRLIIQNSDPYTLQIFFAHRFKSDQFKHLIIDLKIKNNENLQLLNILNICFHHFKEKNLFNQIETLSLCGLSTGNSLTDDQFSEILKQLTNFRNLKTLCFCFGALQIQKLTENAKLFQRQQLMKNFSQLNPHFNGKSFKDFKKYCKFVVKNRIMIENLDLDFFNFDRGQCGFLDVESNISMLTESLIKISELQSLQSFSLTLFYLNQSEMESISIGIQYIFKTNKLKSVSIQLILAQISQKSLLYQLKAYETLQNHSPLLEVLRLNYSISAQTLASLSINDFLTVSQMFKTFSKFNNLKRISVTLGNWIQHKFSFQMFGQIVLKILNANIQHLQHLLVNVGCDQYQGGEEWLVVLDQLFEILEQSPKFQSFVCMLNNQKVIKQGEIMIYNHLMKLLEKQQLKTLGLSLMNVQQQDQIITIKDYEFKILCQAFLNNLSSRVDNFGLNLKYWNVSPQVEDAMDNIAQIVKYKNQLRKNAVLTLNGLLNQYNKSFRREIIWDIFEQFQVHDIEFYEKPKLFSNKEYILEI